MHTLGYLLIAAGFLAGSYFAAEAPGFVRWPYWWGCLAAGILGVILARLGLHRAARAGGRLTEQVGRIGTSLESLARKAAFLNGRKESLDVYEVRHVIDAEFMEDLDTFVDARESLSHRYGVQAYAEIMTRFATAERYLNRCWSASADGYIDEVHEYLGRAEEQFREALEQFQQVKAA